MILSGSGYAIGFPAHDLGLHEDTIEKHGRTARTPPTSHLPPPYQPTRDANGGPSGAAAQATAQAIAEAAGQCCGQVNSAVASATAQAQAAGANASAFAQALAQAASSAGVTFPTCVFPRNVANANASAVAQVR